MKYIAIGLSVTAAILVAAIIIAGGYNLIVIAAGDPQWRWVLPIVAVAILVGVIAGAIEYLTDRKEKEA